MFDFECHVFSLCGSAQVVEKTIPCLLRTACLYLSVLITSEADGILLFLFCVFSEKNKVRHFTQTIPHMNRQVLFSPKKK